MKRRRQGTRARGSFGVIKEPENVAMEPRSLRFVSRGPRADLSRDAGFRVKSRLDAHPWNKEWIGVFNYDSSGLTGDKKPDVFVSLPCDSR